MNDFISAWTGAWPILAFLAVYVAIVAVLVARYGYAATIRRLDREDSDGR